MLTICLKGGDGVTCWSYFVKSSLVACLSQMSLVSATSFQEAYAVIVNPL